jgi:hypothetical protein
MKLLMFEIFLSGTNVGPLVICPNLPATSSDTNFKGNWKLFSPLLIPSLTNSPPSLLARSSEVNLT